MKKIFFLFGMVILMISCDKENITFEDSTFVSDPEEIKWPFVYGQIFSENGETMSNVQVEVFQNDTLVGTVFSDTQGKYSTHLIKTDPDYSVTIKYHKQDYANKYRRFEFETSHYSNKDIVIGKETSSVEITKEIYELTNPADTNLIKIYGYARLSDGTPVSGVSCEAVWQYLKLTNVLLIQKYTRDFSDADGYFELLVPKNRIIHFQAYINRYPQQILAPCFEWFTDVNGVGAISQWHYMELGKFESNYNAKLREDIEFLTLSGNVKGKVVSCDGNPISIGKLRISINYKNFYFWNVLQQDQFTFSPNGEFNVHFETCPVENTSPGDYSIRVFVDDPMSKYSGEKELEFSEVTDLGMINLCIDNNEYPGEFDMIIGSDKRYFSRAFDNPTKGKDKLDIYFNYEDGNVIEYIILATDQVNTGVVPVLHFKYWKGLDNGSYIEIVEKTFEAKPEDVIMTITKIENDYVFGQVTGEVDTPQGRKSVSGTFRVFNK